MEEAAEALRAALDRPCLHVLSAQTIVERLTGRPLGAAQVSALDAWRQLYSEASRPLHGAAADPARAADLYRRALAVVRQVFVPSALSRAVLDAERLAARRREFEDSQEPERAGQAPMPPNWPCSWPV